MHFVIAKKKKKNLVIKKKIVHLYYRYDLGKSGGARKTFKGK